MVCTKFSEISLKESDFCLQKWCVNVKITIFFITSEQQVGPINMNPTNLNELVFVMLFNGIPLMAMLKLTLAITIVAITTKMTIFAMAIGVINMAILGIQIKGIKQ